MAAKTYLITGGAGFIGSHLTEALLKNKHTVVVIDNFNRYYSPKIKNQNLTHAKTYKKTFRLIKADLRHPQQLNSVFNKYRFDSVIHLAAMAGVRPSIQKPTLYANVNIQGTINLLEAMKRHKVTHLIMASSSSVYGNRKKGPFKESDPTDSPASPYGATKKSTEVIAYSYAQLYDIKTTIFRLFTVYGPRNRPDMACFKFTKAILTGQPLTKYGNGTSGRDYTFITDVVNGFLIAINKTFDYEIINLGNHSPIKLNKMISTIEKNSGKKAMTINLPFQPGDVSLTFADNTKAKRLLDWQPQYNFSQGISQLIDWYNSTYEKH